MKKLRRVILLLFIEESIVSDIRDRFIEWKSEMDIKYSRVFSVVDIAKAQMDKWGNVLPFYKNIKEEGIVLWNTAARKDSVEKSAEFLCLESESS